MRFNPFLLFVILFVSLCFVSSQAVSADDIRIMCKNKSLSPLTFLLFQKSPGEMGVDTYLTAWKVGNLGVPGSEGPFILPERVSISVSDTDESDPRSTTRVTGPVDANYGEVWQFTLQTPTSVPVLSKISGEQAPAGTIIVKNSLNTYKMVTVSMVKNGSPIINEDVVPNNQEVLEVDPVLYAAVIKPGSMISGDDFRAVDIIQNAVAFQLPPGTTSLNLEFDQLGTKQWVITAGK